MITNAEGSVKLLTDKGDTIILSNNELKEVINELITLRELMNKFLDKNHVSIQEDKKNELLSLLGVI